MLFYVYILVAMVLRQKALPAATHAKMCARPTDGRAGHSTIPRWVVYVCIYNQKTS